MIKAKVDYSQLKEFCRVLTFVTKSTDERIYKTMKGVMALMDRNVQKHLRGGSPLFVRSGRLRSSIFAIAVMRQANLIVGEIGTNVFYGRIHEFGGTYEVKAHDFKMRQMFGYWISEGSGAGSIMVTRGPFTRKVPARPWLRPGIAETMPQMMDMLRKVGVTVTDKGISGAQAGLT